MKRQKKLQLICVSVLAFILMVMSIAYAVSSTVILAHVGGAVPSASMDTYFDIENAKTESSKISDHSLPSEGVTINAIKVNSTGLELEFNVDFAKAGERVVLDVPIRNRKDLPSVITKASVNTVNLRQSDVTENIKVSLELRGGSAPSRTGGFEAITPINNVFFTSENMQELVDLQPAIPIISDFRIKDAEAKPTILHIEVLRDNYSGNPDKEILEDIPFGFAVDLSVESAQ